MGYSFRLTVTLFTPHSPSKHEIVFTMSDVLSGNYDPTQISLMNERCILLNDKDEVIGYDSKKNCHLVENIEKGLLHRAFSVFIFNDKNELLLQQRASEKITFPDYWTNTCCSHPLYFENADGTAAADQPELEEEKALGVRRAARRKLFHELGIAESDIDIEKFTFLTRIHYMAASDS